MSFVDGDDVIDVNERLLAHVFERVGGPQIELPMQRMCYDEAMGRFGTDRPDLRFGLELVDLGDALRETEFKVFRSVLDGGGAIRGINAGRREMPRSELDGLISRAQELGAKGLVWAFREGDGWRSPTAKFLSEAELADLNERLGAEEGDLLLLVADKRKVTDAVLGQMRIDLAERFDLIDEDEHTPGLDRRLAADGVERARSSAGTRCTIPFTAPAGEFDPENPGAARAHRLRRRLERPGDRRRLDPYPRRRGPAGRSSPRSGSTPRTAEARFGFLLEALRYGAPPHGGIAYGVDRIVQRLSRRRDDPRRDRLPEDRLRLRPADRRPGPGRRASSCASSASRSRKRKPRRVTEMGLPGLASHAGRRPGPGPGQTPVHVDDPSFDSWEVVRDFGDVRTARAWHQALVEAGIEAALTADWPLDRFGHGDICPAGPGRATGARPSCTSPTSISTDFERCRTWPRTRSPSRARWYG